MNFFRKLFKLGNYKKISTSQFKVYNQNGFNNALYDYYKDSIDCGDYTKKDIRRMVQNWPKSYPATIIIKDLTFECSRIYIEIVK